MGPIEHAVCQIAFKVEKKYNDKEFVNQILQIATLIHNVEIAPKDWETNQDIRELHTLGHNIRKEIEEELLQVYLQCIQILMKDLQLVMTLEMEVM